MKRLSMESPAVGAIGASRVFLFALVSLALAAAAQSQQVATGRVWEVIQAGEAPAIAKLPAGQVMNLDLVLPLRDPAGLDTLLGEIYDPTSRSYGQFLTVEEFAKNSARRRPSMTPWWSSRSPAGCA